MQSVDCNKLKISFPETRAEGRMQKAPRSTFRLIPQLSLGFGSEWDTMIRNEIPLYAFLAFLSTFPDRSSGKRDARKESQIRN